MAAAASSKWRMMKPLILETKLIPPDCSRMLERPRLLEMIAQGPERLVVLCSDIGYGKTITMGQYFHAHQGPKVWYQLDRTDQDIFVFLAHLIGALRSQVPNFGSQTEAELAGLKDVDGDRDRLLTMLVNELSSKSIEPCTLFFDDFHHVNDSGPVTSSVQFLISHMPSGSRIIIAGRERPQLSLGRLRTQRKLLEIGTEDLKFNLQEATGIFAESGGQPLDKHELESWHEITEGWPVALMLSGSVLGPGCQTSEEIKAKLLGSNGAITGYLMDELWADLSEETQGLLMDCSLMEIVEIDICGQALAHRDYGSSPLDLLKDLEHRNIMVDCIEVGKVFHLHPILQKFLRNRLEQGSSREEIGKLHHCFGEAYADSGDFSRSIHHYLEAGSPELAARVIEIQGEAILASGKHELLAGWLSGLPAKLVKSRPWLTYFAACNSEHQGDINKAANLFETSEAMFSEALDTYGLYSCAYALSESYFLRDQHRKSLKKAGEALRLAAAPTQRIKALSRMGTQNLLLGKNAEALDYLHQAADLCDESMDHTRFTLRVDTLSPQWFAGDFIRLLDCSTRLQKEFMPKAPAFTRFQILCWKVLSLYEMARYREALAAIEEREDYLGKEDRLQTRGFEFLLGVVLLNLDDGEKGRRLIEDLEREKHDTILTGPFFNPNYLGSYFRHRNEADLAIEAHSRNLNRCRKDGMHYTTASCLVNLGADKLRQKDSLSGTTPELDEAGKVAHKNGYKYILTQFHFHCAWRALKLGETAQAAEEITRSLNNAAEFHHDNFITQEGRISLDLLVFAFENDIQREYLTRIFKLIGADVMPFLYQLISSGSASLRRSIISMLADIGGAGAAPYIRRGLRDEDVSVRQAANKELALLRSGIKDPNKILTRRESQVLSLLSEGLSNLEIANRLYISEPTVKSHVTRVFKKLGLTRRSQVAVYFQQSQITANIGGKKK